MSVLTREEEELMPSPIEGGAMSIPITDIPLSRCRSDRYLKRGEALVDSLSSGNRHVLLSAPAGYGKTTIMSLLSERMATDDSCRVIWLDCAFGIKEALESLTFQSLPPQLKWQRNIELLGEYIRSLEESGRRALIVLDWIDATKHVQAALTSPPYKKLRSLGKNTVLVATSREECPNVSCVTLDPLSDNELWQTFKEIAKVELSREDTCDLMLLLSGHPLVCELAAAMMHSDIFGSISDLQMAIALAPSQDKDEAGARGSKPYRQTRTTNLVDRDAIKSLRGLIRVFVGANDDAVIALGLASTFLRSGMDDSLFRIATEEIIDEASIDLLLRCGFVTPTDQISSDLGNQSKDSDSDDTLIIMHDLIVRACLEEGITTTRENATSFLESLWLHWCSSGGDRHLSRQVAYAYQYAQEHCTIVRDDFLWQWIAKNREALLWRRLWDYEREIETRNSICRLIRNSQAHQVMLRPAYERLDMENSDRKLYPMVIADAENLSQKGFAMRRMGRIEDARYALESAAKMLGWDKENEKWNSPEESDCALLCFRRQLAVTLSSLGYTYSVTARFGEQEYARPSHEQAVRLTRAALGIAGDDTTTSRAIALHYTNLVEYWLAQYMLTERVSDQLITGRNPSTLLKDAIRHEEECQQILNGLPHKALGSVPPMDRNSSLGLASALLSEMCEDESSDLRAKSIRKLRKSIDETVKQRGKYSQDAADRSMMLSWMEITESQVRKDAGFSSIPERFASDALGHAKLAQSAYSVVGDEEGMSEASDLCRAIEFYQLGHPDHVLELLRERRHRFS